MGELSFILFHVLPLLVFRVNGEMRWHEKLG
jgi:hypothetical protein